MKRKRHYQVFYSSWMLAIAGTIIVHGVAIYVMDLASPEDTDPPVYPKPFVLFLDADSASGGRIQAEQAALLDSAPLFLPSRWNTLSPVAGSVRETKPEDVFELFPPEFYFSEASLAAGVTVPSGGPRELQEYVFEWNHASLDAVGRRDPAETSLEHRFALFEAIEPGSPSPVASQVIPRDAVSEDISSLWAPAEFSVIIDSVGMIGSPFLLEGSGEPEVDRILEKLLDGFLIDGGGGLAPGYYRILIGP